MSGGRTPSLRRQVLGGFFWKFGERILAQGISFAVSVVLARLIAPSEFGVIALTWIFIALANVFVVSGFATALVQNKDATDVDFSTNFHCSLAVSLVLYAALFAAAPAVAAYYGIPQLAPVLRVMGLRIPVSSFSAIQHAWVERHMAFRKYFFSTLAGTLLSGAAGVALALRGFGVWALVAQYFTNTLVDIAVLSFTVPWRPRLVFSVPSAKRMMSFGWKVLAADLSGTFFDQLRSLLVGKFYTPADLAFYNKGKNLPELLTVNINSSIMSVLFPAIANINGDRARVKAAVRRSVSVTAYVLFPCLSGLATVAPSLILVLYTEKWASCVPYVQILGIAATVSMIGLVSLQVMKALGRSDVLLKLEFYKKPVYIGLLVLGVKINVLAVAWTMLAYACYGSWVNATQLKSLIGYGYREQFADLAPSVALSAAMAALLALLARLEMSPLATLLVQVPAGAAFYVAASAATGNQSFAYLLDMAKRRVAAPSRHAEDCP